MYNYDEEIKRESKAQKKRWNGKVITTSKQWIYNDHGSIEPVATTLEAIFGAFQEAKANDYYMM